MRRNRIRPAQAQPKGWSKTLDRAVLAFALAMVLLSFAPRALVSPHFAWLTAFSGVNLSQSAFTGFCPAAQVFRALGIRRGCAFDEPLRPWVSALDSVMGDTGPFVTGPFVTGPVVTGPFTCSPTRCGRGFGCGGRGDRGLRGH